MKGKEQKKRRFPFFSFHSIFLFYLHSKGLITHLKFAASGCAFANALNVQTDDIYYCPLPLYHASASMLALGIAWTRGMTFAFRKKFKASTFWNDCLITDSTVIQYIGELCSYLLGRPSSPADTRHKVRFLVLKMFRFKIH